MFKLYIVPTPIGNLGDITERSKDILKNVGVILCEDTKITGKIKNHIGSKAKMISLHKFNEISRIKEVRKLLELFDVALVSDAGTPTISDPGQIIVNALKDDINIIPLPGPCSITTALSASGLLFNNFTFIGFFEKEENKIINKIKLHLNNDVIVAFESPKRINKTLKILRKYFGDIDIVLARELTKIYEEIIRGPISKIENTNFKGEIVLIIPTIGIKKEKTFKKPVDILLKEGLTDKTIINFMIKTTEFKKNDIYNYLKEIK